MAANTLRISYADELKVQELLRPDKLKLWLGKSTCVFRLFLRLFQIYGN
jgi:hypothetical protein